MTVVIIIVLLLLIIAAAFAISRRIERAPRAGGPAKRDERPLGDTPEAHAEVNPHDIPLDNPGRAEAVEQSGDIEGTTGGDRIGGSTAEEEGPG